MYSAGLNKNMTMISLHITSLSILSIILAATIVSVALTEFGSVSIAQGQANVTSSLTPEQKAAICDPNDTHVNATESRICGKPITPSGSTANANATSSSENNTSQSTILPSFIP